MYRRDNRGVPRIIRMGWDGLNNIDIIDTELLFERHQAQANVD